MKIEYAILGNRIKIRRQEFKMTQSQLAEKCNISNNHLSAIENGREKPSLEVLCSICQNLNVTPDYVLLGAIRPQNIPEHYHERLLLCRDEDILLADQFIELLIERNRK